MTSQWNLANGSRSSLAGTSVSKTSGVVFIQIPLIRCGTRKAKLGFRSLGVYAEPMADTGDAREEILVDARGHRCPVPTLRLRRALEAAGPGGRVRLLADDPLAKIDVPYFADQAGFKLVERSEADGTLSFLVARPAA
jgi:tRNA 2-thiouridine synthesizing protein A